MVAEPTFTLGVEEEYLIVEAASGELVSDPPRGLMESCVRRLGEQVTQEFMRSQIEVGTKKCEGIAGLRSELVRLRTEVAEAANEYGFRVLACSTHPSSEPADQIHTDKVRYDILARDLQAVGRRLLISGMHVHIGIEDSDLRIDLMGQVAYFLPHLLALSTSSPYWRGTDTGLMSYRIAVWDELPRTGLPESFRSWSEYEEFVGSMRSAGLIEDASKIWWDIRPNGRYPTLEMRICDLAPRLDDTLCIAALYACIIHMLFRLRVSNQQWRRYSSALIAENRWRAQRYGIDETLVDFGIGRQVLFGDLLEEMLELVAEDMEVLECVDEAQHARRILNRGTGAHLQRRVFQAAQSEGASTAESFERVVRAIADATVEDL